MNQSSFMSESENFFNASSQDQSFGVGLGRVHIGQEQYPQQGKVQKISIDIKQLVNNPLYFENFIELFSERAQSPEIRELARKYMERKMELQKKQRTNKQIKDQNPSGNIQREKNQTEYVQTEQRDLPSALENQQDSSQNQHNQPIQQDIKDEEALNTIELVQKGINALQNEQFELLGKLQKVISSNLVNMDQSQRLAQFIKQNILNGQRIKISLNQNYKDQLNKLAQKIDKPQSDLGSQEQIEQFQAYLNKIQAKKQILDSLIKAQNEKIQKMNSQINQKKQERGQPPADQNNQSQINLRRNIFHELIIDQIKKCQGQRYKLSSQINQIQNYYRQTPLTLKQYIQKLKNTIKDCHQVKKQRINKLVLLENRLRDLPQPKYQIQTTQSRLQYGNQNRLITNNNDFLNPNQRGKKATQQLSNQELLLQAYRHSNMGHNQNEFPNNIQSQQRQRRSQINDQPRGTFLACTPLGQPLISVGKKQQTWTRKLFLINCILWILVLFSVVNICRMTLFVNDVQTQEISLNVPEPTTIIHTYKRKVHGRGHDHSGSQHDLHHNDKLSKSTGIDANKLYEEIIVVKDISTEQGPKASIDWMQILNEEYK